MELHHHVPAARLTKEYFHRWWYWKGVAKSRLERRHPITELGVDLRQVPIVAGVPRFLIGSALRDAAGCMGAMLSGNAVEQMRRQVRLCYFAGYFKGARSAETAQLTRTTPTNGKPVPSGSATHSLHL
jgi:hypothetical protein